MTLDEAMTRLRGLTTREIREFMRPHLSAREAESFEVLVQNVSYEVLLLVSARALTRLAERSNLGRP